MSKMSRVEARRRRHYRIRKKLRGTPEKPRLSVCRSNRHLHIQFIDDTRGHTLASVSSLEPATRSEYGKVTVETARELGKLAGERAQQAKIEEAIFDRGGFKFHGRVKAVAEGAREAGLKF